MLVKTESITSTFDIADGQKVFYRIWKTVESPKAIVLIVHGFNSHSGYYQWTAEQLVSNHYETYAIDLRGHGNSTGERFYIADYNEIVSDINQMVSLIKAEHPHLPVFLLGHSAGGVFSTLFILNNQERINGFICESFAYQLPAPDFAITVLEGLSHIVPHAHVVKLKNEDFSRDKTVVDAMNHDPLIAHEVQPAKTIQQLALADEQLKRNFQTITLPLLIIHGTSDKATKPGGSQEFFDKTGSSDKTLTFYEGHYHDLLNDIEKDVVVKDIIDWLDGRV